MDNTTRVEILNIIFSNFQQVSQWIPNHLENSCEYMRKAESLIELLEVKDCGSVGGFDRENPLKRESGMKLYDRFLTLLKKYDNEKDIEPRCNLDVQKLKEYFLELSELRNKKARE